MPVVVADLPIREINTVDVVTLESCLSPGATAGLNLVLQGHTFPRRNTVGRVQDRTKAALFLDTHASREITQEAKSPTFPWGCAAYVATLTGLEPATSAVTGRHSNQLSYRAFFVSLSR